MNGYGATPNVINGWIEIGASGYLYHLWTTNGINPDLLQDECTACSVPYAYYPTLNPVLMKTDLLMYDTVCYFSFFRDSGAVYNSFAYFNVESISAVNNAF